MSGKDHSEATKLLEIEDLAVEFQIGRREVLRAVDGVSLAIDAGEVVGLVGESGSGKTTLGKAVVGLREVAGGRVLYRGEALPRRYRPSDFREVARKIQMIFQDPSSSLNPRMTAGEIVGEGSRIQGMGRKEVEAKVVDWFDRVGLSEGFRSRYPHELSGGQRQRLGIARALILEPAFVVCDEPLSALDVSVQAQIVNLLRDLKQSMGLTLLFIAHDLSMVRYFSDRIAVLYRGALVEVGPSEDVFFRPQHPYTQLLIGSNPEPDPRHERSRKRRASAEPASEPIAEGGCSFADRCPEVMERCRSEVPRLTEQSGKDRHRVACFLFGPT